MAPLPSQDLFQFLFRQLLKLQNPSDPHFSTYFYTAESLANVKSIALVADLAAADELMLDLFKQAFDTVSSSSPKNVTLTLTDLLVQLLEEVDVVSNNVIDALLPQFLPRAAKARPAAFRLAIDVSLAAADKLQRGVCQYFADILDQYTPTEDDSDDDDDEPQRAKGRRTLPALPSQLVTAHSLIASISRVAPPLLMNVIPLLSASLGSPSAAARALTTSTLGAMLGEKPGQGDVAAQYPAVWRAWLGRARDKEPLVRAGVADKVAGIWKEHPELKGELELTVRVLLHDAEDRVRYAATAVFRQLDYESAAHHVSLVGLEALADRCKDRKEQVRDLAFETLGRLYGLAFPEIENKDSRAIAQFGWIPGHVVSSIILGDVKTQAAIRASVRDTIQNHILPPPSKEDDEPGWVDRFLLVYSRLNATDQRTLLSLSRLAEHRPSAYEYFVQACEHNNGGVIDGDAAKIKAGLKQTIRALSARLPDSDKVADDLDKFAQANEKALYKLLRTMVDPQTDQKTLTKTAQEVKKRTAKVGATLVESLMVVVREHAFVLLNKSSIPPLLKRAQAGWDDVMGRCALEVINYIAKKKPAMFRSHVAELTKSLADTNSPDLVAAALHALSRLAKADEQFNPDKGLSLKMVKLAKGDHPKLAKYAATVVALDRNRMGTADDLVAYLVEDLADASGVELVARLSALGRLARHAIAAVEPKSIEVATKTLELLFAPSSPEEETGDDGLNWLEDDQVSSVCLAREGALRVIVNRALAYAEDEDEAQAAAGPVFDTLWPLLSHNEETQQRFTLTTASRLRVVAVNSLLKLATFERFHDEILGHFGRLAQAAQDSVYQVRAGLVGRVLNYLREGRARLPPRLNLLLFLMAHDPEPELRSEIVAFVRRRVAALPATARTALWEHPLVRLVSLLAHHSDYARVESRQAVLELREYLQMYLDCIATKDNISYLYHLALKIKTVRDISSSAFDPTLYKISELAQHLIQQVGHDHKWPLSTHALPVKMPGDIFRSLPNAQTAREVSGRQWLKEAWLKPPPKEGEEEDDEGNVVKKAKARPKGTSIRKERAPRSSPTPRKRAGANGSTGAGRKAKKVKKNNNGYYSEDEVRGTTSEEEEEEEDANGGDRSEAGEDDKSRPTARGGARGGLRSGLAMSSEAEDDQPPMEVDSNADSSEDEEPPKSQAKAKPAAASKSKPTSAAKGQGKPAPASSSSGSAKKTRSGGHTPSAAEVRASRTRGAVKGLAAPRPLRSKAAEAAAAVSDVSDEED